jgi:hypothetical protein
MKFGQTRRENPELAALSLEEIKSRQKQAAARTHEIKRATTEGKIKAAINAEKETLNNSSIAKKAGLHRQTVIGFSKLFAGCRNWWYQVVGDLYEGVVILPARLMKHKYLHKFIYEIQYYIA